MALGARRADILRMVMREGLMLSAVGFGLGTAGALALTHTLASFLYGVEPLDPLSYVVTAAFIAAVGLVATLIPAARATRVDPLVACRVP
jgi:putative ABC transport system permease protein